MHIQAYFFFLLVFVATSIAVFIGYGGYAYSTYDFIRRMKEFGHSVTDDARKYRLASLAYVIWFVFFWFYVGFFFKRVDPAYQFEKDRGNIEARYNAALDDLKWQHFVEDNQEEFDSAIEELPSLFHSVEDKEALRKTFVNVWKDEVVQHGSTTFLSPYKRMMNDEIPIKFLHRCSGDNMNEYYIDESISLGLSFNRASSIEYDTKSKMLVLKGLQGSISCPNTGKVMKAIGVFMVPVAGIGKPSGTFEKIYTKDKIKRMRKVVLEQVD